MILIKMIRANLLSKLGLIVSDVITIPNSEKAIVHHDDGRAYLIDFSWLREIAENEFSTDQIKSEEFGPTATPWFERGYPDHIPWNQFEN